MKPFLFLITIALLLGACRQDQAYLQEDDKIVLQNRFGRYCNADRNRNDLVVGNRLRVKSSSVFKVKPIAGNAFQLTDFENNPLFYHKNALRWKKGAKPATFYLKEHKDRVYLLDASKNYVKSNWPFLQSSEEPGVIIHRLQRKNFLGGYLGNEDILSLVISLLIFLFLILNQLYHLIQLRRRVVYGLIFIAHFLVALFAITQFDFLFYWDEMFHALVAKNLSIDPTVPKLYHLSCLDPELSWAGTEVWLHKQPLFLYQMAAAIKVFGVNAISPRIPSLLMMSLAGLLAFRMGSLVFNRLIGLIASMIFCFSLHKLELLFGVQNTDHNDITFLFYVTASFWAFIEYRISKKKWAFIGVFLFAAFAVLTKWLLGFLVYYAWGLILLINFRSFSTFLKELKPLLGNFALSALLVIPWQLYIFWRFPEIAGHEYGEISRHFSEAVEGHRGEWNYHLLLSFKHYGIHYYLLIIAPILAFFSAKRKQIFLVMAISVVTVYIFYSLAATKMISFTYVLAILVCLFIAAAMENLHRSILHFHPHKKNSANAILILSILLLCFAVLNPIKLESKMNPKLSNFHFVHKEIRQKKFKRLHYEINQPSVLFNAGWAENINAMYHNDDLPAYSGLPNFERLQEPPCEDREILIFNNGKLPKGIEDHPRSRLIPNY